MTSRDCGREGTRSSALWGSGRGGQSRANALWGKGGRGALVLLAGLALAVPLAGTAASPSPKPPTYIAPALLDVALSNPQRKVRVIVQSFSGASAAERAVSGLGQDVTALPLVGAVAVTVQADALTLLQGGEGLTVTPDALIRPTGDDDDDDEGERKARKQKKSKRKDEARRDAEEERGRAEEKRKRAKREACARPTSESSSELRPADTRLWDGARPTGPPSPAIAIVDSGIEANRADFNNCFDNRVVAQVNLTSLSPNSPGDGRGHGTLVAGIAAGGARGHLGAAPDSKIVAIDVMDDTGKALTSDVIRAAGWIVRNKATYGIRVANFSLHAGRESNFTRDPLDRAVEKLWFSGVVVVAAAGNTGTRGVKSAPGNDPFVITVGAVGPKDTAGDDDDVPSWSSFGYTHDGFAKPDLSAPGRNIVGPVPAGSTLARERPSRVVAPGYMKLSGTSLAAPVVAGAAARILARHPNWSPDQVKGALMVTARAVRQASALQVGVGKLDAARAVAVEDPPNPNLALNRFVVPDPAGDPISVFDAASWEKVARADASWDSASWSDAAWDSASWDSVTWTDVSWTDVTWTDVTWSDVTWSDVTWSDVTWSDVSWSDALSDDG